MYSGAYKFRCARSESFKIDESLRYEFSSREGKFPHIGIEVTVVRWA